MSSGTCSYLNLGWLTEERDGHVELITGTVVDALEVPSAAGILAASWWRFSEGYPDEVRKLPALPDPRQALALIAAGDRHFFLTRAGECPWRTQDPVTTAAAATPRAAAIRWHSRGSRIQLPATNAYRDAPEPATAIAAADAQQDGAVPDDEPATVYWAHWPVRGVKLPSPVILLHLLATAAAATRLGPHMLTLEHDVLAIPAFGDRPIPGDLPSTPAPVAFGFSRGRG
jgi:hypothetical protein